MLTLPRSDNGVHVSEDMNWGKFALWDQATRILLYIHAPAISTDASATQ